MTQPYSWTTFDDEIATNAIIFLSGTSTAMLDLGLSYVEPKASIFWAAWSGPDGQITDANIERGPWTVPDALKRAEELRHQFGFSRVVIQMEEYGLWRDEWGTLAEEEGYHDVRTLHQ